MHVISRLVRVINHAHRFGDLVIFVVSCENDYGRMISKSLDHFFSFILDVCIKLFVGWVLLSAGALDEKAYESTTKHEILPD